MLRLPPFLFACGLLLSACAVGQRQPLTAGIVADNALAMADLKALVARLAQADVLLLGEVHDNAQGHALRTRLLQQLHERAPRPTVLVMEHFDLRQQDVLDRARADAPGDVSRWIAAAAPSDRWPWKLLQPALELARDAKWKVSAANLSRGELRAGGGTTHDRLPPLPPASLAALIETIRVGHCGMLSPSQAESVAQLQRRRDQAMARVVEQSLVAGTRVVLLAGNGHIRKDFGVPRYLPPEMQARAISVGFVERGEPAQSADLYDHALAVPAQARKDPCADLRMPKPAQSAGNAEPGASSIGARCTLPTPTS